MTNLRPILNHLQQEQAGLQKQVQALDAAINVLGKLGHVGGVDHTGKIRHISKAGRARIAAAQRARWAKSKGQKVVSIARKHTMSASARKKIAAVQKARWAKWRKAHKKA